MTTETRALLRCTNCGDAVEDEGLCVPCWDLTCEREATGDIAETKFGPVATRRNIERDRLIRSLWAEGWTAGDLAGRFEISKRRIYGVLRTEATA